MLKWTQESDFEATGHIIFYIKGAICNETNHDY